MARIIYKDGCEGQNRLESIEGIEIELFNGQKALIFPKYAEREILKYGEESKWDAKPMSEIEALKMVDSNWATGALLKCGSPAAEFVSNFRSDRHGIFCLPTLVAAMEVAAQKGDIDALAEMVEGADLLRNFSESIRSCSRGKALNAWVANGDDGCAGNPYLGNRFLCVPVVLYR